MTKDKLIKELTKLANRKIIVLGKKVYDEERNHEMADRLLLKYINDEEITDAFDNIKKWYA